MSDRDQKIIFSWNLRRHISMSGKKQSEIAEELGILPSTLNTWCTGHSLPRMGKVQKLADYFGISISDLIDEKKEDEIRRHYVDDQTMELAQELHDNKDLRIMFDSARNLSPEDLKFAKDMLLRMEKMSRN